MPARRSAEVRTAVRAAVTLLPDLVLVLGVACALSGAFLLSPYVALAMLGVGLIALSVWMGV